jgi:hypothetical protein
MLIAMDNSYQPQGSDPQDRWATENMRGGPGPAGAGQDHYGRPGPGAGRQPSPPSRRGRALRWTAGIVAAVLLAGGGGIAAAKLLANSTPAGPTGQAAVLNSALNSPDSSAASAAASPSSAAHAARPCLRLAEALRRAGHPRAALIVLHACRRRLLRLRVLGGIHGEFTFETLSGPRTLAFERGVIESVTSGDIVVRAVDGTTWTWDLISRTVVRENGKPASTSALSDGELVFVGGPVISGGYDARLIVIRQAAGGSASGSS